MSLFLYVLLSGLLASQPLSTTKQAELKRPNVVRKISVTVERQKGDRAERMDPAHVFESGELVRFRFQSNFPGYLYVLNHSTSGKDVLLFPKEETGTDNRVDKDREYVMPMTESGWFRMEGPAGHEVTYWVMSPMKLSGRLGPVANESAPPPATSMTPRCDDSIFQARGDCIDVTAGFFPSWESSGKAISITSPMIDDTGPMIGVMPPGSCSRTSARRSATSWRLR